MEGCDTCMQKKKKGRTASEIRKIMNLPTTTEYIALITGIKQRKRYVRLSKHFTW